MTWFNAPAVDSLLNQLLRSYPKVPRSLYGTIGDAAHAARKSDHNPGPDGEVKALDIPHRPGLGLDANVVAEQVANSLDPRISYVIWNRRIWEPGKGWRPYTGTSSHTDHIHVSVKQSMYKDASPWKLVKEASMPTLVDKNIAADLAAAVLFREGAAQTDPEYLKSVVGQPVEVVLRTLLQSQERRQVQDKLNSGAQDKADAQKWRQIKQWVKE